MTKRKSTKKKKVELPPQPSAVELEVSRPSAWLRAVQKGENVSPSYMWYIDKERIYSNYEKTGIRSFDSNDNEIFTKVGEIPQKPDYMRVMSELVLILPNGKVVTPIRQYCETKVLPSDVREALFYGVGPIEFIPQDNAKTIIPESTVDITCTKVEAKARDTPIKIEYAKVSSETNPIDIIAATNRAFALESINDENGVVYDAVKKNNKIKTVIGGKKSLFETILEAKGILQNEGLDDSNLIMYTSGKIIRDLTLDPSLDSYIGFSKPAIITEATIERIAGVNLVRDSNATETKTRLVEIEQGFWSNLKRIILRNPKPVKKEEYNETTSILFIPNVAFGLVVGKDITMEAQRRNELQMVHVNGTQRSAAVVKVPEACVKIIN